MILAAPIYVPLFTAKEVEVWRLYMGVFSLILAGPAPQGKSLWLPDPRRGFQKREPANMSQDLAGSSAVTLSNPGLL